MSSPADPSGCTGLSWTDDAWANRTNQTVTGGTCGQSSLTINTSNKITNTGFGYDSDGNLTNGTLPYQYDAEDRLTQFNNGPSNGGANYVYDANGRRVEKVTSTGQVHYFYDENGSVAVETDQNGNWTKDYVYMGGQRVAEFSGGQTYFIHADHLGSTRTVTNYAGSVTDKLDYLPYGEQIAGGTFTTHKFTGYERDSESGLDYASARYYTATLGRFMSVDPAPIGANSSPITGPESASADPYVTLEQARRTGGCTSDPQSLNRYGYVTNDPLALTDPSGRETVAQCQAGCVGDLAAEQATCTAIFSACLEFTPPDFQDQCFEIFNDCILTTYVVYAACYVKCLVLYTPIHFHFPSRPPRRPRGPAPRIVNSPVSGPRSPAPPVTSARPAPVAPAASAPPLTPRPRPLPVRSPIPFRTRLSL